MGYSISSATLIGGVSTNVTLTSGFAIPGSGQTITQKSSSKSFQSVTAGTGFQIHTTTGGKTYYVTSITIQAGSAATLWEIRDGTSSAGTLKACGVSGASITAQCFVFPTPIAFATGVWLDVATTATIGYTVNGFEQ